MLDYTYREKTLDEYGAFGLFFGHEPDSGVNEYDDDDEPSVQI